MGFLDRTLHPDEANQAYSTGKLLETGSYTYNPSDHHGPTLYYAAAPLQKIFGADSFSSMSETALRCTPFSFALLALFFAAFVLKRESGSKGFKGLLSVLLGVALIASSPIFAFFATDFIQEMLLTSFLFAAFFFGSRLESGGRKTDILATGFFAGLAFATKETAALSFVSAFVAAIAVGKFSSFFSIRLLKRLALMSLAAAVPIVLLFSSFGSNISGIYDAFVSAPLSYFVRATGSALSQGADYHVHAPYWYLSLFFGFDRWSELILLLALVTCFMRRKMSPESPSQVLPFLVVYTSVLLVLYSLIPYKTPWCMLQVISPLTLAAAVALVRSPFLMSVTVSIAIIAFHAIGLHTIASNPDDVSIPFNYASASSDVKSAAFELAEKTGASKTVAVVLPAEDIWPLPWYLRTLEGRVGYWTDFDSFKHHLRLPGLAARILTARERGKRIDPAVEINFRNLTDERIADLAKSDPPDYIVTSERFEERLNRERIQYARVGRFEMRHCVECVILERVRNAEASR